MSSLKGWVSKPHINEIFGHVKQRLPYTSSYACISKVEIVCVGFGAAGYLKVAEPHNPDHDEIWFLITYILDLGKLAVLTQDGQYAYNIKRHKNIITIGNKRVKGYLPSRRAVQTAIEELID